MVRSLDGVARACRACSLAGSLLATSLGPATAQIISGRVVDEVTERPVPSAVISLLGPTGEALGGVESGRDGSFELTVEPGVHRLKIAGTGYAELVTPYLAVRDSGTYAVELLLVPVAVPVEGLEVTAPSHHEDLERLGLRREDIGSRLIGRDFIDRYPSATDPGHIIERRRPPGTQVIRSENVQRNDLLGPGSLVRTAADQIDLCVTFQQARTFDGANTCAASVVDGLLVRDEVLAGIAPADIEAILVLRPIEARQLYGTAANGGAVLVYTRRGRPSG